MLLPLRLLHWSALFQIALTSAARHDIYTLHRRCKLILEVGDLILQMLQMGGLNSRVLITCRHFVRLDPRLLRKLELVLHLLRRPLITLFIIERFGGLVLCLFIVIFLVMLSLFLVVIIKLLLLFSFQVLILLHLRSLLLA